MPFFSLASTIIEMGYPDKSPAKLHTSLEGVRVSICLSQFLFFFRSVWGSLLSCLNIILRDEEGGPWAWALESGVWVVVSLLLTEPSLASHARKNTFACASLRVCPRTIDIFSSQGGCFFELFFCLQINHCVYFVMTAYFGFSTLAFPSLD